MELPGWLQAVLIGGAFAAVVAFFVARKSEGKQPIEGGTPSRVAHYLGALGTVAPLPVLLVGAFALRLPFGTNATLCLGSLGLGFGMLLIFGALEVRARHTNH